MSQSIFGEIELFLNFLLLGVWVGGSYSLLLLSRRLLFKKKYHGILQDCLFGPIWSLQYFYEAYKHNNGITRWYMIAGVVFGCVFWYEVWKCLGEWRDNRRKREQDLPLL